MFMRLTELRKRHSKNITKKRGKGKAFGNETNKSKLHAQRK